LLFYRFIREETETESSFGRHSRSKPDGGDDESEFNEIFENKKSEKIDYTKIDNSNYQTTWSPYLDDLETIDAENEYEWDF